MTRNATDSMCYDAKSLRNNSASTQLSWCEDVGDEKGAVSRQSQCCQRDLRSNPSCCGACRQNSSSTLLRPCCDDYGESDASLRSYHQSDSQQSFCCCSFQNTVVSRETANKLLQERLREFGPSKGDRLHVSPESGKSSFITARGHKIELSIQSDMKYVSISTVIHTVKHGSLLSPSGGKGNRNQLRPNRGSYSLMTKMMKYNAILKRSPSSGSGHILACDGIFVYFATLDVSGLTRKGALATVLEDMIIKAGEMSEDFAKTPRRRFLRVGACY